MNNYTSLQDFIKTQTPATTDHSDSLAVQKTFFTPWVSANISRNNIDDITDANWIDTFKTAQSLDIDGSQTITTIIECAKLEDKEVTNELFDETFFIRCQFEINQSSDSVTCVKFLGAIAGFVVDDGNGAYTVELNNKAAIKAIKSVEAGIQLIAKNQTLFD